MSIRAELARETRDVISFAALAPSPSLQLALQRLENARDLMARDDSYRPLFKTSSKRFSA